MSIQKKRQQIEEERNLYLYGIDHKKGVNFCFYAFFLLKEKQDLN